MTWQHRIIQEGPNSALALVSTAPHPPYHHPRPLPPALWFPVGCVYIGQRELGNKTPPYHLPGTHHPKQSSLVNLTRVLDEGFLRLQDGLSFPSHQVQCKENAPILKCFFAKKREILPS